MCISSTENNRSLVALRPAGTAKGPLFTAIELEKSRPYFQTTAQASVVWWVLRRSSKSEPRPSVCTDLSAGTASHTPKAFRRHSWAKTLAIQGSRTRSLRRVTVFSPIQSKAKNGSEAPGLPRRNAPPVRTADTCPIQTQQQHKPQERQKWAAAQLPFLGIQLQSSRAQTEAAPAAGLFIPVTFLFSSGQPCPSIYTCDRRHSLLGLFSSAVCCLFHPFHSPQHWPQHFFKALVFLISFLHLPTFDF